MDPKNSEEKMLKSILEDIGVPGLLKILSETPMWRLKSVLISAFKNRVSTKKPAELSREYERNQEFFGVSSISQIDLLKFALKCHEASEKFEDIQTSPISPLGLNSVLSMVSQNNTLSTIRGTEVVSDPTTQLAMECALRRKRRAAIQDGGAVHISTMCRVLRLQPFDKNKGFMQHFNLFALCSGGSNVPERGGFAVPVLRQHIETLLQIISELHNEGYESTDVVVKISDMRFLDQLIGAMNLPREKVLRNSLNEDFNLFAEYNIPFPEEVESTELLTPHLFEQVGLVNRVKYFARLEQNIMRPLRLLFPSVRFCFDFNRKAGLGYYPHLCFHIYATNRDGDVIQVADGGAVDWAGKLLNNSKEAMVTSGIGAELMQKLFRSSG